MRLTLAQINPVVGDLDGNRALILERLEQMKEAGADLALFPELATTGYPPEDLLLRPGFLRAAARSLDEIAAAAHGLVLMVGAPHVVEGRLFDALYVCAEGEVKAIVHKRLLPNYGVFDEKRYFEPGDEAVVYPVGSVAAGLTVCEDLWQPGPAADLARAGAELLVNISASPFHVGKDRDREKMFRARARAPGFEEALLVVDLGERGPVAEFEPELESMRLALELGLADYVRKNGFHEVVVSISGGIDSALTAALAAEALGPERVHTVSMPSRYSSEETRRDARRLAENLGCPLQELSIEPIFAAYLEVLSEPFTGREPDLAEENLQARIRGTTLMALSNKFGWLLVATGNKSELSVGYSTLYGDLAGGFALIKDVYKTDVFRLAKHLNERAERELIPQTIIDRAPSAELREGQLDEDSLPPYPELDRVLEAYVEHDRSLDELSADGFDPDVVARAVALIDRAEYKRRQAPPGVRLRPKAFGRDRRTPITNRWRG